MQLLHVDAFRQPVQTVVRVLGGTEVRVRASCRQDLTLVLARATSASFAASFDLRISMVEWAASSRRW